MKGQFFINEIDYKFSLRDRKSDRPTPVYFVTRITNIPVRVSLRVKVYPEQWNPKRQEAYLSCRLSELDYRNNLIVNERINKIKVYFSEFKCYLCEHPDEIEEKAIRLLKQYINKVTMKEKTEKPATFVLKQLNEANQIADSSKKQHLMNLNKFKRFLDRHQIQDSWDSMNLETFNRYQEQLVNEDVTPTTISNIVKGTLFSLLKKASKRTDIPFKWEQSNLESFEIVQDKSNKELARNKKIALTEEQVQQLYSFQPTGDEKRINRFTEIRDLFVLQCLLGQRISDMYKFFSGDYEWDEENETVSIIQQKTGSRAIIPLTSLSKDLISKYAGVPILYYKSSNVSQLNKDLKVLAKDAGLDDPITYEENSVKKTKPLYELIHTHTARHSFVTIMCRKGIPKDAIIIATGHEDTKMIDEVYAHLTIKDKSQKVRKAFGANKISDVNPKDSQTSAGKVQDIGTMLQELFREKDLLDLKKLLDNKVDISSLEKTVEVKKYLENISRAEKYRAALQKFYQENPTGLKQRLMEILRMTTLLDSDWNLLRIVVTTLQELGLNCIYADGTHKYPGKAAREAYLLVITNKNGVIIQ
ncbi:integrase family protein [Phocaeicola salanitronis DSM 18170]|uniref:Integrase family protein n=1 Tax=Phocaeicola salanitronis (strain DSM 18170 / JCM 13657 / CCUG 60908 / BL78) TaxID=667015 RepID=F0R372_PHOSB|nr:tyrosine-type recombinase/integrase [Phocaeicola salanitronis]ADY37633.1 integrase family protein [Phocaeicola salanitronis DSM 18170]